MTRKVGLYLLLLMMFLVVGCGGSTQPASPAPAGAATPAAPAASVTPQAPAGNCVQAPTVQSPPYGSLRPNKWVQSGLCEALVDSNGFYVTFTLPAAVDEAVVRNGLRTEGATPQQVQVFGSSVQMMYGPGPDDQVITLRLVGPLGQNGAPVDMGFRLRRHPAAFLTLELQDEKGNWSTIPAGQTVPRRPLTLRFQIHGKLDKSMLEASIRQSFEPNKDDPGPIPLSLDWDTEGRLVLKLPEPPPLIQVFVGLLPGEDGLESRQFYTSFFTGEPPRLVAVDPASGAERSLGEAPVDIWQTLASPNGKWVLPLALRGDSTYALEPWLLNVATGDLHPTGLQRFSPDQCFWLGDRLINGFRQSVSAIDLTTLKVEEQASEAQLWSAISPDGRFLAGFTQDASREDPKSWLAPSTLVIHDLQTGREQLFPDAAWVGVHHSEAPPSLTMFWSADGATLFFPANRPDGSPQPQAAPTWLALDRQTGKITTPSSQPQPPAIAEVPAALHPGPTGWSYEQTQAWDTILLHGPKGESREAGRGLPLAWQPSGSLLLIQ